MLKGRLKKHVFSPHRYTLNMKTTASSSCFLISKKTGFDFQPL